MPRPALDPIVVLMHPARVDNPNHTVLMLTAALPADITVEAFTWRRAFTGRYRVLHVHWPEQLVGSASAVGRVARCIRLLALIALNRLRGTPMAWTVHNERPHEVLGEFQKFTLRAWSRMCSARVFMYDSAMPTHRRRGDVMIRRGDYRPLFRPVAVAGSGLLSLGLIRPYKGIESLIGAFRHGHPGETLTVAGFPDQPWYADHLQQLAGSDPAIAFDLRHIPDVEIVSVVEAAELMVLPYATVYNSGVALLALTLRRPILVPRSATMVELRDLVGRDWVHLYEGTLTAEQLLQTLAAIRGPRPEGPHLDAFDWALTGQAYGALYRSLAGITGRAS